MANRFTPRNPRWVDTEVATAQNFANRIEDGLEALDLGLDATEARVDALQAQLALLSDGRIPYGPTSARPSPAKGQLYFDEDLGKPLIGNGSSWIEFGTGEPPSGPGSSTAPQNFTAVVQPNNAILCSWSPVPGASHYKLYEVRSPNGVSGADNITTTSTVRTPSTMGYYEYWVTAFVDGVESAQSNHGICSLPYGSDPQNPGTGTPAGSPAELLAFGAGGGEWNLGVGYPSGHVDITPQQLMAGWSQAPYFYITEDGAWVHFQVPMNGGRTSSNTKYPRTELREYRNGSKASWNGSSGTHLMSYRARMMHIENDKPEAVIGQIHDGDDDTLQIRWENGNLRASINGSKHPTSLGNFPIGAEFAVEIKLVSGTLTIKVNGSTKITTNPGYGSGQYFKIGMYAQQNNRDQNNPANGYASCDIRDLVVQHS
jgi:hypothetical protein